LNPSRYDRLRPKNRAQALEVVVAGYLGATCSRDIDSFFVRI
jgi:hypothetical protein